MADREDRRHLYKRRPLKQEDRRKQAAAEQRELRAQRRTKAYDAQRGIEEENEPAVSRQQKLEEWKKRRVLPETKQKQGNKPAFVFTKITYNDSHLYKPFESTTFHPPKGVVPVQSSQPARHLRPRNNNQQKRLPQTVKEAVGDFASAMAKASKKRLKVLKPQIPFAEKQNITEILNSTFECKSPSENFTVPEKENIFEEVKEDKCEENHRNVQTTKSNRCSSVHNNLLQSFSSSPEGLGTSSAEPLREIKSADFFRSLHSSAVAKLNDLCNQWTHEQSQELPDAVADDIDVAVGYAQLLISQKLQQFLCLIVDHENINSSAELKVLSTDLEGFWGLVNNQLQDIYRKFEKLQAMKLNNWQHLNSNSQPVKEHSRIVLSKPKMIKSKGNASSGMRSFLAQARRQARMGDENCKPDVVFDASMIPIQRPMSPVVMIVATKAKQLGSPQTFTQSLPKPKSPLNFIQTIDKQTPKSTKRTPARKRASLKTPGSTPYRRSARLLSRLGD